MTTRLDDPEFSGRTCLSGAARLADPTTSNEMTDLQEG